MMASRIKIHFPALLPDSACMITGCPSSAIGISPLLVMRLLSTLLCRWKLVSMTTMRRGNGAGVHNLTVRNRNEFVITDTELKLIAAAARIGLKSQPKNGYSTPAAIGTPTEL